MPSAFDSVDLPWSLGFPGGSVVKNLPAIQESQVQSLDQEDPLEKGMATHSSIVAGRIPWTEEPVELHTVHEVTKSWMPLSMQARIAVYYPRSRK